LQLWESVDVWHRLEPKKLLNIIELSEKKIGVGNHEIEVEYQGETIGKYGLEFDGGKFILSNQKTACLAEDACGIPIQKVKKNLSELTKKGGDCCDPIRGCC